MVQPVPMLTMLRDFVDCLLHTKDFEEAKTVCEYILQSEPFDVATLLYQSEALLALGMLKEAMNSVDTLQSLLRAFDMATGGTSISSDMKEQEQERGEEKDKESSRKRKSVEESQSFPFKDGMITKTTSNAELFESATVRTKLKVILSFSLFYLLADHTNNRLACTISREYC